MAPAQEDAERFQGIKYDALEGASGSSRPIIEIVRSKIWPFAAGIGTAVVIFLAIQLAHSSSNTRSKAAEDIENEEWNHCGRSSAVAMSRGCLMEPNFYGWFPSRCVFSELTDKYAVFEDRTWYSDVNLTQEIPVKDLWEGKHAKIYTKKMHGEHCLYQWRKLRYGMENRKEFLDTKTFSGHHAKHCADQLSERCEGVEDKTEDMAASSEYSDSKDESSTARLLASDDGSYEPELQENIKPSPSGRARWIIALILSTVLTSIISVTITLWVTQRSRSCPSVSEPPAGVAPILRGLPSETKPTRINTPFYNRENSIYREHDSPSTEAAWLELTQIHAGILLVSKEEAKESGINPDIHAYFDNPEKGLVGHPVLIEATHQLHCLNLLRRYSYFNFNYTREVDHAALSKTTEYYQSLHVDHCVEYLRYRLMCTADVGIVPFVWAGQTGRLTADMDRTHTCRDYEAVRQFVKQNSIPRPTNGEVKPKPGDHVVDDYI
ncbi:hypothetical protein F5Y13DRAFT_187120 [Hypoxylon sp. FL1857]|nr:hypothetical protein F5Y13DRAFT_187120 [Hypoxylon sp. FL1857]